MNLVTWLEALAGAFGYTGTTKEMVSEYLETLGEWKLTDEQWIELKRQAKLRFEYFPKIAQLHELMLEISRVPENPGSLPTLDLITVEGRQYARRPSGNRLSALEVREEKRMQLLTENRRKDANPDRG